MSTPGYLEQSRLQVIDDREALQRLSAAVGVDLLPVSGDAFVVLEVNGAVEFDERYSLPGGDVYRDIAAGLGIDGTSVGGDVRHLSA